VATLDPSLEDAIPGAAHHNFYHEREKEFKPKISSDGTTYLSNAHIAYHYLDKEVLEREFQNAGFRLIKTFYHDSCLKTYDNRPEKLEDSKELKVCLIAIKV